VTIRRQFMLCLAVTVAVAGVAAVTSWLHAVRASQHDRNAAVAQRRWQTALASFSTQLRVPQGVRSVTSAGQTCQRSATHFCWRSRLLPQQLDPAVVTAVRAAGGQSAGRQFDPVNAGCQPPVHPEVPGTCTHSFALAGGVILVELFPHHVLNMKAPLTFDGSDVSINAIPPSAATS
jgi:hypothetical protein